MQTGDHADQADNADWADHADRADHADSADSADHADSADSADHADSAIFLFAFFNSDLHMIKVRTYFSYSFDNMT